MVNSIRNIFRNATLSANLLAGMVKRIDYRTLNRYIQAIHQKTDLEGILAEASRCLKDVLNYRLFAFAVVDDEKKDAWVDPRIFKDSFEVLLNTDFQEAKDFNIHYLCDIADTSAGAIAYEKEQMVSYHLVGQDYFGKLYLIPQRRLFPHHQEIIGIILRTIGIAITNLLHIRRLEYAAALDPLTGCYNRREFTRIMGHHVAGARRHGRPLSVIMFDLDHFKSINDRHGHHTGDNVLKITADTIQKEIRQGDYLARYGGEEFVIILPDTKIGKAIELAERLRSITEALDIIDDHENPVRVTASFGVATLKDDADARSLLKEVDDMLYRAKASGRNLVMPSVKLHVENARN